VCTSVRMGNMCVCMFAEGEPIKRKSKHWNKRGTGQAKIDTLETQTDASNTQNTARHTHTLNEQVIFASSYRRM
jgi:hypothetical protein